MSDPMGLQAAAGAKAASDAANNAFQSLLVSRLMAKKLADADAQYQAEQERQARLDAFERQKYTDTQVRQHNLDAAAAQARTEGRQNRELGMVLDRPTSKLSSAQLADLGVDRTSPLIGTVFKGATPEELFGNGTRTIAGYAGTPGSDTATKGAVNIVSRPTVDPDSYTVAPTFTQEAKQAAADLAGQKEGALEAWRKVHEEGVQSHNQAMIDVANRRAATAEGRAAAAENNAGKKQDDAGAVADAIIAGEQPPDLARMYSMSGPVRAALAHKGYNLTRAQEDWNATSKYIATLNGPAQTRLRQAVDFTDESLGKVEELATQWKSSGLGVLSRARLGLAAQGALGQQAQSLATRFQSQIADVTSELAGVYRGGNSSTDESLALAAKNLQADWSEKALTDNIAQIRQNLGYRRNSLRTAGVAGASAGNPYAPQTGASDGGGAGTQPGGASGPAIGTRRMIRGTPAVWDGHGWVAQQ